MATRKRGSKNLPAIQPKGLQKFTDYDDIPLETEGMLRELVEGEPVKPEGWSNLTEDEQRVFFNGAITYGLQVLANEDRDKLVAKYACVFEKDENKNALWALNHNRILEKLHDHIQKYSQMPSRLELSKVTGLSRQTVNKHLAEYFNSTHFVEKKEEYLFLRERILGQVYRMAANGDVKACKLFLDTTDSIVNPSFNIKHQQNNFIQINGVAVTEEQINLLPEKQRKQLEKILKPVTIPVK